MVKTYSNNTKDNKVGKCLFFPKAKCMATVNKPIMDGWLMRSYVMTPGKKHD